MSAQCDTEQIGGNNIHLSSTIGELIPLRDKTAVQLIVLASNDIGLCQRDTLATKNAVIIVRSARANLRRVPIAARMIQDLEADEQERKCAIKENLHKIRRVRNRT